VTRTTSSDRRIPFRDAPPAILAQSFHAFGNGALFELAAIFLLHDQFPQRLRHDANFVNGSAALIAGVPALFATFAPHECGAELF